MKNITKGTKNTKVTNFHCGSSAQVLDDFVHFVIVVMD